MSLDDLRFNLLCAKDIVEKLSLTKKPVPNQILIHVQTLPGCEVGVRSNLRENNSDAKR